MFELIKLGSRRRAIDVVYVSYLTTCYLLTAFYV